MRLYILSFLFISLYICPIFGQEKDYIDYYNISWNTPSKNASESMPLGGGDLSCNVWVENGDIMVYPQRSGSFSENGEYLKLGRIRLKLSPNPYISNSNFKQYLNLKESTIYIISTDNYGKETIVKIWVDMFTHSLHYDIKSNININCIISYENWRTTDKEISDINRGRFGCFTLEGFPGKVIKHKDSIEYKNNGILFYHKNPENSLSPNIMIKQQGLEKYKNEITNTISNLIFGGYICGDNLKPGEISKGCYQDTNYKSWTLKTLKSKKHHHFQMVTHIEQTPDLNKWIENLNNNIAQAINQKGNISRNHKWWSSFWEKSWIITDPNKKSKDNLWEIGRNYQLFRYQLGCNLMGKYPSKFNGGSLTFDPSLIDSNIKHDPDWRQWGGDIFTAQNQRLLFWPMLKTGDFDGMVAQFNIYKRGLNGAKLKVKKFFGHNGAMYCEYANDAGLDISSGWGWSAGNTRRRGEEIPFTSPEAKAVNTYSQPVEHGIMANGSISYHWESQIEHAYMILEYNRYTGRNIDEYMPFIKNSLVFFDEHYQKRQIARNGKPFDENGKLVFFPSTSCESYRGAKNPIDLTSGIRSCIESLLILDSDSLTDSDKTYFKSYLKRIPDLYFDTINGDTIIKPAESYIKYQNVECPQFYPLFPFNRYDIESPLIPLFRNTWKYGNFPKNMIISWHQDGIFYARMGMTDEAYKYNLSKLKNSERRFPTFWGPGHDWVPDHNWGGSGMIGLQEMLMQTIGDKIYILPSWPKNKDVKFKMYAPHKTIVEVEYIDGEIKKINVSPKYRMKDIIINNKLNNYNK